MSLLSDTFYYNSGKLYWKTGKKQGKEAGTLRKNGYVVVYWNGKDYYVHRIIFELFYNYSPKQVDHVDGVTYNNDIDNLREASKSQNAMNAKCPSHNTSGIKGISWNKERQRWIAKIVKDKKVVFKKRYTDFEQAR